MPYLGSDAEQPHSDECEPLMFLPQVRWEDPLANEFPPGSGLLHTWQDADDLRGADLDESVTARDVLTWYEDDEEAPLPPAIKVQDGAASESKFALRFSAGESTPKEPGGHQRVGRARFVQEDPRPWDNELRAHTV